VKTARKKAENSENKEKELFMILIFSAHHLSVMWPRHQLAKPRPRPRQFNFNAL